MRTISVQTMPNGFEVETPSFGYWFKAGAAFTAGALVVGAAVWLASTVFFFGFMAGALRAFAR